VTRPLRVLLIEDREDDALLVLRDLRRNGFEVRHMRVDTAPAMEAALQQHEFDIVLSDFSMPSFSAPAALEVLKASGRDVPFIIVSGTVGEDVAVTALKAGAHDFLPKHNLNRLVPALERELREAAVRRERRALEQQLRQAQKMDAVGRLAGGIAHDFNNILTAIQGYAALLLRDLPPQSQSHDDAGEIMTAALRASSLTRQLLAFSRNQVTQPELVDIDELVTSMHNMLSRVIGSGYELALELGAPAPVFADRGQLGQVLMNLVVNARDAMPHGGFIRICTFTAQPPAGAELEPDAGAFTVLRVIDEGLGMSADVVERIFEPFFTTKESGKGTGLGLSTVYGIVTQQGGVLDVDTAPGRGTCFSVYLPPAQGAEAVAAVAEEAPSPPNIRSDDERTVLVVEDEPTIREVVRRMLVRAGYTVVTAESAAEALQAARDLRGIDVLLSDVMLPDMSGTELMQPIARLQPGIRTVLMSGYAAGDVAALPPGVAFIEKPFSADSLMAALRDASASLQ